MPEMNQAFLAKLMSGQYNPEAKDNAHQPDQPTQKPVYTPPLPSNNAALEWLPIDNLSDYPDQPLPPYTEADMIELIDSIRQNGIITPLIVRPHESGWQIIDGRNRRNGARQLSYPTVPCIVRELTDDDAAIYLVETIFKQRDMTKVSIMQRARAYRLWLDAMNRQGRRNDLTSPQSAAKLRSDDQIAQGSGISGDTVRRLVRLTYLIPELQDKVDANSNAFSMMAAVAISYLSTANQNAVDEFFFTEHSYDLTIKIAERLKSDNDAGVTFSEEALQILWQEINDDKRVPVKIQKVVLPTKKLERYFKSGHFTVQTTVQQMEDIVFKALDLYFSQNKTLEETGP